MELANRYTISFHDDFLRTMRSLVKGHRWFLELPHCLNQLERGDWSGTGLRVKPLQHSRKGESVNVFEARINKADRLLFSRFPSHRLVIFDLVKHDEVNHCFRRFIGWNTQQDLWDMPTISWLVPALAQTPLVTPETIPETPRLKSAYIPIGGCQIYCPPQSVLTSSDRLEIWCREQRVSTELLLTEEQESILSLPSPILLSGNAGSGKTTSIAHRLSHVAKTHPGARSLYLTYLPKLADEAKRAFESVLQANDFSLDAECQFLTIRDLCRRLQNTKEDGAVVLSASGQAPFGERGFEVWWNKQRSRLTNRSATDIWAEIRGVIKGRVSNPDHSLLPEDHYIALPASEGLLPLSERSILYRVANQYQAYLKQNRLADEMDWARLALKKLLGFNSRQKSTWAFDSFYCDEVQDLTALELQIIKVLWRLSHQTEALHPHSGIDFLIAGDPHQVVYPSAFRWSDVASFFYEGSVQHGAFESITLQQNFRSTQPILELAEKISHGLKQRLLIPFLKTQRQRLKYVPFQRDYSPQGEPPVSIVAEEAEAFAALSLLPASAKRVILTRDRETAERLSACLDQGNIGISVVCAIEEFKGLEADCIILWRYFADKNGFWSRVEADNASTSLFETLTECNRLYVAVTRCRNTLVLFDEPGDKAPWHTAGDFTILSFTDASPDWLVQNQVDASTPDEWRKLAIDFELQRQFSQARKCYLWAGDTNQALRCEALTEEEAGKWDRAAMLWHDMDEWDRALEAFGRTQIKDNNPVVAKCRAEVHERDRQYFDALELWINIGDLRRAALLQERLEMWIDANEYWSVSDDEQGRIAFQMRWLANSLTSLRQSLPPPTRKTSVPVSTIKK